MSRIGKKEINIPVGTEVRIENNNIYIKGKNGELIQSILAGIYIKIENQKIFIECKNNLRKSQAFRGLTRTLIQNMVFGVNNKFLKTLVAEGIGYKFQIDSRVINLNMGYSHIIKVAIPENLSIQLNSPTKISISGIDKQQVGLFASRIRSIRPPEPYKGKGIRYENETIKIKAGKTGK